MDKKSIFLGLFLAGATPAFAGGFLTNTNQSSLFLRNPAIDAYLGSIENAYSNPAGTAFLSSGFHVALNIQNARQQRIIRSTFAPFGAGMRNNGQSTKEYTGKAYAPVVPSFQVGYNVGKWAFSSSFGIVGGGGKCDFSGGLASFEASASMLPVLGSELGITSYDIDTYMRGRQYFWGFQVGAAYKVKENLSVYAGLRTVYGTTNYYGYVKDITVGTAQGNQLASEYFMGLHDKAVAAAALYEKVSPATAAAYAQKAQEMMTLSAATQDVTLNCDQTGWGFAPIVSVDWKISNQWNLAAKYEFKTSLTLKNKASSSTSADNLAALDQFKDGKEVAENIPALFTVGVQYTPIEQLRLSAGFHFYDDKHAEKYGNTQELLNGGTKEYLAGVEYDFTKKVTASIGWQMNHYELTDAYMRDMSFVTCSNSIGLGVRIHLSDKVRMDLGYFHTFYKTYDRTTADYNNVSELARLILGNERVNELMASSATLGENFPFYGQDSFTRKNRVFAASIGFDF